MSEPTLCSSGCSAKYILALFLCSYILLMTYWTVITLYTVYSKNITVNNKHKLRKILNCYNIWYVRFENILLRIKKHSFQKCTFITYHHIKIKLNKIIYLFEIPKQLVYAFIENLNKYNILERLWIYKWITYMVYTH